MLKTSKNVPFLFLEITIKVLKKVKNKIEVRNKTELKNKIWKCKI